MSNLACEKVWLDKTIYSDAERKYYESLSKIRAISSLVHETVWLDKAIHSKAEKDYYESLAKINSAPAPTAAIQYSDYAVNSGSYDKKEYYVAANSGDDKKDCVEAANLDDVKKDCAEAANLGDDNKDCAETANIGQGNTTYTISLDNIDIALLEKWERQRQVDGIIPIWDMRNLSVRHEDYFGFEVYIKSTQKDHNFDDKPRSEEEMDLDTYIKIVNTVQPSGIHTINAFDDYLLEIKAMTGEKVMVSVDNYLGYSTVRDTVQCLVCRIVVKDIETHKLTMGHLKKMVKPLRNIHCIRQIDTIWNHCVICNEIVENSELHTSTYHHKTQLQQAMMVSATKTKRKKKSRKVPTTPIIINNQNNVKIPADIRTHIEIPTVDPTTRQVIPKSSAMGCTATQKDSQTNVDYITVQNISKSPTGDITTAQKIPEIPTSDLQVTSNIPKPPATDLNITQKILDVTSIKNSVPKIPSVYVLPGPSTSKAETQVTATNMKAFNNGQNANNVKQKSIFCDVCKVSVPNNPHNIETHYSGSPHKNNLNTTKLNEAKCEIPQKTPKSTASHLKESSAIVTKNHSKAYCTVCDFTMHQNDLSSHLNGKYHKLSVQNNSNDFTATIVNQKVTDDKVVTPNPNLGKTQHFCSICMVKVPNNASNIKAHDEGRLHKTNLNILLIKNTGVTATNKTVSLPASNDIVNSGYNAIQSVTFSNKNTIEATNTRSNVILTTNKGLKNIPRAITVHSRTSVVNNVLQSTAMRVEKPANSKESTGSTALNSKNKASNINDLMDQTHDPTILKCKICKVKVPKNNTQEHIMGSSHKIKLNSLMLTNRIKEDCSGKYSCEFCKFSFTRTDFYKHINRPYHKVLGRSFTEKENSVDIQDNHIKNDVKIQAFNKGQNPNNNYNKENFTSSLNQASTSGVYQMASKSNCGTDLAFAKTALLPASEVLISALTRTHADITSSDVYPVVSPINRELSIHAISRNDINEKYQDFATYKFRDKLSVNNSDGDGESKVKASDSMNYVECKYCKVKLSANDTNMVSHTNGSCVNDLLIRHGMKKMTEHQLWCGLCVTFIWFTDILDHINDTYHKEHYNSGKIPENIPLNITLMVTQENIHRDLEFDCFGNLFCPACKICVPRNLRDMSFHVRSKDHNDKCENLMKINKMKQVNHSGYMCEYCDNYILDSEMYHVRSGFHIHRMTEAEAVLEKRKNICKIIIFIVFIYWWFFTTESK